ncbi:dephospho-CoA kinase [Sulfurirhabdus autotrophica]|uniref:Dephospho-CoA kinase n=1 Tax=Sulfurirhabdus autotrophica TaxID=1706046 RepID=A0A4R3XW09_9PROT|nr:dephospho-CoA kinase [Sulfurirhabdus autotrophica]TCV83001.1 dephospho-CoA kinase [Sulfurirhabdus autotrophica]
MVYTVGLTGGIGCGKSSAARLFASLGAAVIDTDEIAHQLTALGQPALASISAAFGNQYFHSDGNLDRARMRQLIFSDQTAKIKLENILHPLIKQQAMNALSECTAPYALIVVPLLLETGNYDELIQRKLLVDCTEEQQISRTMARSKLTVQEVQAIMATQIPRNERLALADDIITNTGEFSSMQTQVLQLHETYLQATK